MFSCIRASYALMDEVRECINSNSSLYEKIIAPEDFTEHNVDERWAEKNFKIREFYLGRADGQYVGMGSYQNMKDKFAYIGYFYIRPNSQQKGFGKALMGFLEMRAKLDKITDIRLFANSKASWALNFYKKNGFSIISEDEEEIISMEKGIFRPYYEKGAYLLQKII